MKTAFKILLCLVALAAASLLLLSRFEIRLPQEALERLSASASSTNWLVRIDSVSCRFPKRIRINGARLLNRLKAESRPFLSIEQMDVNLSLLRLPWRIENLVKSVTVIRPKMPRLPDGYYIPDSIEFPGSYDFVETDSPVELDIPDFMPFQMTIIDPDILDLRAKRVSVDQVSSSGGVLRFANVRVAFPDRDAQMEVTGDCEVNIPGQRISGSVHGQARQPNIRPMLQALDITNCYQFIDAFTGVTTPVDAGCRFDVNLRNSDLRIFLDLHPTGGAYRGVPLETAQGNVDVRVFVRDHYQNAHITVGPIVAHIADGSMMTGAIFYENTNDIGYVTFRDIRSTTSLSNALAVADVLNDGTLDCLQPETPPTITLDGILAVDPAHAHTNHLDGTLAFDRGHFFGIPLVKAFTAFQLRSDYTSFTDARASMPHGGSLTGSGLISFPGFDSARARFMVNVTGKDISLEDMAATLGFDVSDRSGSLSGHVELEAPLTSELAASINGKAELKIKDGRLARLNLFAGLTDYLAQKVPGISSLVDQSNAEMACVISNGILRATKVDVSGDVFAITGKGSYSIPDDNLDFKVRVRLFKNDSIIGKIANPITWTFSKLLLEFKVYGPIKNPKWDYISVLERLL